MKVRVKLHSMLRAHHLVPGSHTPFGVDLPPGARVADLAARLGLPPNKAWVASINREAAEADISLNRLVSAKLSS